MSAPTEVTHLNEKYDLPSFDDHIFLIFGYGSILWKQNFEFTAEYPTYIKGYKRVFYQGSRDHRGVPGAPGRVVTLLHDHSNPNARVYGKAYQLPTDPVKLDAIFNNLDVREQGGYDRVQATLYDALPNGLSIPAATTAGVERELDVFSHPHNHPTPADVRARERETEKVVCLCYIATPENEDFLGEAPLEEMAAQILSSAGPSGENKEYLFHLAECLREMGADDPHVFALDAAAKRQLAGNTDPGPGEEAAAGA